MPHGENESLGAKLGNFVTNNGMARDDFFRVEFARNIAIANQNKVGFCLGATPNCGSDGLQFEMTAKPIGGGKISAPYNIDGNDNLYALSDTVYAAVYQCGVSFTRDGDTAIKNVVLDNFENRDVQTTTHRLSAR